MLLFFYNFPFILIIIYLIHQYLALNSLKDLFMVNFNENYSNDVL